MVGPRYLSLEVIEEVELCPGPVARVHDSRFGLVYDLKSGRPVDWSTLLPTSWITSVSIDQALDGTRVGLISSSLLRGMFLQSIAQSEANNSGWWKHCEPVLTDPSLRFVVVAEADTDGLLFMPWVPPRTNCEEFLRIPTKKLRAEGVSPTLVSAIEAAHADYEAAFHNAK
jgi:hypothetical protein